VRHEKNGIPLVII